ncbi:hypothetical protein FEK30_01145 (plasmid) [Picosynechococcus sp. PCC 11901]|uniref:hypothetical protein n=1 Tax=Picosynechococcus sp. PCC 11901 TaxID=2579791 RepID=UPI0010FC1B73|nr:hypothetical protein [Picosynechococcus sp. PCC 11901]QCS48150.1 hypothetical protein FEK30_01145 [Picosynechococcus sp. PCC 11901]
MPSKNPKTTIRFHSEESKERFDRLKNDHGSIADFIDLLLDTYENYKHLEIDDKDASKSNPEGEIIYLSPEKKEYFDSSRKDKDTGMTLGETVKDGLNLDSLEMSEGEFLKLAAKVTGQSEQDIISKGLQSYGQTAIAKIVKGSAKGLGSQDDEITEQVKTLAELVSAGTLPQFSKLTVTTISQFTSKNYNTIKGWAERKGVLEMIKDKDHYVDKDGLKDFLAKL